MINLSDKVVWITGASSGIGEALTYAMAAKGAKLILSARRLGELERIKSNCKIGERVRVLRLDVADVPSLPTKVDEAISIFGKVDILINCAGMSQRSFAAQTSFEVYRSIMETNFFGTIQLSLALLPHFLQRNIGQFVTISSVAGVVGLPKRTAYSAAKHALEGFFSSLRTETWRTNIKILIVRPGAVKTNISQNALVGDGNKFSQKDAVIEQGISPAQCAHAIIRAIEQDKTLLEVGSSKEKLLFVLNRLMPGFVFNKIKKLGE